MRCMRVSRFSYHMYLFLGANEQRPTVKCKKTPINAFYPLPFEFIVKSMRSKRLKINGNVIHWRKQREQFASIRSNINEQLFYYSSHHKITHTHTHMCQHTISSRDAQKLQMIKGERKSYDRCRFSTHNLITFNLRILTYRFRLFFFFFFQFELEKCHNTR